MPSRTQRCRQAEVAIDLVEKRTGTQPEEDCSCLLK